MGMLFLHLLSSSPQDVPEDCTVGYHVDFVWRGTSFDRMRNALNTFRKYSASISGGWWTNSGVQLGSLVGGTREGEQEAHPSQVGG